MEPTILKVQFYGAISFLTEPTLIILLGKDHIHVKKQAKVKPDCEHFLKEIKQYGTVHIIRNRKAKKTNETLPL